MIEYAPSVPVATPSIDDLMRTKRCPCGRRTSSTSRSSSLKRRARELGLDEELEPEEFERRVARRAREEEEIANILELHDWFVRRYPTPASG